MQASTPTSTPWYKQFWPWVVIGLPLTSVVAGLTTVVIAFAHRDSLVRDDWYRDGVAINRRFDADDRARLLGMRARLSVDREDGEVTVLLEGRGSEAFAQLEAELSHIAHADRDQVLFLTRDESGVYRGQVERGLGGRWYATLRPRRGADALGADVPAWRLFRRIDLPRDGAFEFGTSRLPSGPQGAAGRGG